MATEFVTCARCKPEWEIEIDGEECRPVFADFPDDAAEKAAERHDSDDYHVSQDLSVRVRVAGTEEWRTYLVSGEATVVYRAEEVD